MAGVTPSCSRDSWACGWAPLWALRTAVGGGGHPPPVCPGRALKFSKGWMVLLDKQGSRPHSVILTKPGISTLRRTVGQPMERSGCRSALGRKVEMPARLSTDSAMAAGLARGPPDCPADRRPLLQGRPFQRALPGLLSRRCVWRGGGVESL